jgi:hypothetical protein
MVIGQEPTQNEIDAFKEKEGIVVGFLRAFFGGKTRGAGREAFEDEFYDAYPDLESDTDSKFILDSLFVHAKNGNTKLL